jgi:hypothetical protein
MTVLEAIKTKFSQRKQQRCGLYEGLVANVAGGCEFNADQAAEILDNAGKTDSDLNRDVATKADRIQYAQKLERSKKAAVEVSKITNKIELLKLNRSESIRAAAETFDRQLSTLFSDLNTINNEASQSKLLVKKLMESCSLELKNEEQGIKLERKKLNSIVPGLQENLKLNRDNQVPFLKAKSYAERKHKHNLLGIPEDLQAINQKILGYQKAIDQMESQLSQIDRQSAEFEKQLQAVQAQMLIP